MGLLHRSLVMLLFLMWVFWLPKFSAELPGFSQARVLDALLQDYAYRAFGKRTKTGTVYDGHPPSNLTGIQVSAMRLRSGSLRRKGVGYKEFQIPEGVIEGPYVERLVLVYQNLGNWSTSYYRLPGYIYVAPVLGLLAYDASNLSAKNLHELHIMASGKPISIEFSDLKQVPDGSVPECVAIGLDGSANFSNVVTGNICSTFQQGHFSIVAKSIAPSPAPISPSPPGGAPKKGGGKKKTSKVWIIVGSVVGGVGLLGSLALLILWLQKFRRKKKMEKMERAAELGEALHMTSVGSTKAPSATVTRTQPTLESEYVP